MAALDSLKNRPAAAGNAALAALVLGLADLGAEVLDLVLADFVPCVEGWAACGGDVLVLALGRGFVASLGVACVSACAQVVWGKKAVKSSDKARGVQRCDIDLGGK